MDNQGREAEARPLPADPQGRAGKDLALWTLSHRTKLSRPGRWAADRLGQRAGGPVSRLAGVHRPQQRPAYRGLD